MSVHKKLLEKAKNNPSGLSFKEFESILTKAGWVNKRQKGSHAIWHSPKGFMLPIQNMAGKAKSYQVKQFLIKYEEEVDYER